MKFSDEWWANYAHPENRCVAHRKNREQCRLPARAGATVCRVHGGAAPQVIAKARERLALAADRMAHELIGIATGAESEAVKLQAVKDALDRAGLGAKHALELSAKPLAPWEEMMMDFATTTRERQQALEQSTRRGQPPPEPLLTGPARPDTMDAEVVPLREAHNFSVRPAVGGADRSDAADVLDDKPATSTAPVAPPPPRSLTQDEAADVMRASRARTAPIHRRRQGRRLR